MRVPADCWDWTIFLISGSLNILAKPAIQLAFSGLASGFGESFGVEEG